MSSGSEVRTGLCRDSKGLSARMESGETRLEKALKMLPAIEPEKLKPSPGSLKQLKDNILKDAQGEEWLRIKVRSLEYTDGFSFKGL
jgi:hypothetical protein